jgi:hypothetical protein
MTNRQILYRKNRIDGMSKKAAALKAGYSFTYATRQGKKLDRVVNMDEWLQQAGLTDKALSLHAQEGLSATKAVSAVIVGKDANERTDDFIDVPDWGARHKYFETILKLRGKLKTDPLVDQSQHTHITVVLSQEDAERQEIQSQRPAVEVL